MTRQTVLRLFRRLSLAMFVLSLAMTGITLFLLGTQAGARFLFARLDAFVPGTFEVAHVDGPIRGPLTVRGLVWHTDSLDVRIDRIALDWHLRNLLRRQLDIRSLHVSGVTVVRGAPKEVQKAKQGPLPDVHFSVNIIVREALVERVAITSPGSTSPFVIDRVELATTARGETVDVRHLLVRSALFGLDASGTLRPQGDYPVNLHVEWTARPPSLPAFAGRGDLGGTLETLRVTHELTAPFRATADATLRQPMRALAFDGQFALSAFDPRVFKRDLPPMALDVHAHAAGTLETLTAEGRADARTSPYGALTATFAVQRRNDDWRFTPLVLTIPGTPARIEATGNVVTAPALRFDLETSWRAVQWPLRGVPLVASGAGRGRVSGTTADYRFDVQAAVGGPQIPSGTWNASGRGDTAGVELARLAGTLLGGTVEASGRAAWSPAVTWDARIAARGIDPGVMVAGFHGAVDASCSTRGRLTPAGPVGTVAPLTAGGRLKELPLDAHGAITLDGRTIVIDRADVTWGPARAQVTGRAGERLDLGFHAELPQLAQLLPALRGRLVLDGRAAGPATAPRVTATASASGLAYGTVFTAERLDAKADVDLAPRGRVTADVRLASPVVASRRFERAALTAAGSRDAHRLTLDANGRTDRLHTVLDGGIRGPTQAAAPTSSYAWRGHLAALDVTATESGRWILVRPAALLASAPEVSLGDACLASGHAGLCGSGGFRSGKGWNAKARLDALPLSLVQPYLPKDVHVDGALGGTLDVAADANGAVAGTVEVRPAPGTITYPGPNGRPERFQYRNALVAVQAGDRGTTAQGRVELAGLGGLELTASLPGFHALAMPAPAQPVRAHLGGRFGDLGFALAFAPMVSRIAGAIDADLTVEGTVGQPVFRGRAGWNGGELDVPQYGLELRQASFALVGDSSRRLFLKGSARSGPGSISLDGSTPLAPKRDDVARLAVRGQRFEVLNTASMRVLVSPALDVSFSGDRLDATGEVTIPEAKLEIKELPRSTIAPSKDVVFVKNGHQVEGSNPVIALYARVRVVLGDDITLKAFGFDGKPTGSLLVFEEPGKPQSGTGEIRIQPGGTFKAYGQDLTIDEGRFLFAGGPLNNPGLDVIAYRKATNDPENIKAGIKLAGTAQQPQLTLWSDPPMSQSDQLAYVLLGHPLDQAQPQEGSLVASAASSLGLKGGNLLAKKIGARFGLEEATVESKGGIDEAALMLGKYLSPRLYIGYGIGLFNAASTFRVRYTIDTHWKLQAETGTGTSADLLYTIERGRPKAAPAKPQDAQEALQPRKVPESGTGSAPGGNGGGGR